MKSEYLELLKKARKLVNDWDPCSFIEAGAPSDQYDSLTNKILSGVINKSDNNSLRADIIDMLDNYYGSPVYDELSKENQEKLSIKIKELIEEIIKTNANSQY